MPKNIYSKNSKTSFKQNLTCILLSVTVNLKYETPCSSELVKVEPPLDGIFKTKKVLKIILIRISIQ